MNRVEEAMAQLDRAEREAEHRQLRDIARQIAARADNAPAWSDLAVRGGG
jgi:hypothetical protein